MVAIHKSLFSVLHIYKIIFKFYSSNNFAKMKKNQMRDLGYIIIFLGNGLVPMLEICIRSLIVIEYIQYSIVVIEWSIVVMKVASFLLLSLP